MRKRKNECLLLFCCSVVIHITYESIFLMCLQRAQIIKFFILELLQIHNSCTAHMIHCTAHDGPRHQYRVLRCQFSLIRVRMHAIPYCCLGCLRFRCPLCSFLSCSRTSRRRTTKQTEYFRIFRTIAGL